MKKYLPLATLLIAFSSCRTYMYFPDRVCVAGLKEKGEWEANVSVKPQLLNAVPSYLSLSGDGVYSLSDNVYCLASYRNVLNRAPIIEIGNKTIVKYNGHRADIGLGTMAAFNDRWWFEAAAGYGLGVVWRDYSGSPNASYTGSFADKSFKASYSRFFTQFGIRYIEGTSQVTTGLRLSGQFGYKFTPLFPQFDGYNTVSCDPYVDFETGKKLRFNVQTGFALLVGLNQGGFKPFVACGLSYHHSRKKPATTVDEAPR